jgi:hypothetical protein
VPIRFGCGLDSTIYGICNKFHRDAIHSYNSSYPLRDTPKSQYSGTQILKVEVMSLRSLANSIFWGRCGGVVVGALSYKPERSRFETRHTNHEEGHHTAQKD